MNILGVIPARRGSKGLPGKNRLLLGGIPLIAHTIRSAKKSLSLCDHIVSTNDPGIRDMARCEGGNAPFLRPSLLSGDKALIWPVVRHAVSYWERENDRILGAVALLQPTSPLRTSSDIDKCVERFNKTGSDICATVTVSHNSPFFNMVHYPSRRSPFVQPMSSMMRSNSRRQMVPSVYVLNGAVYVVRRNLLDQLSNLFQVRRLAVSEMPLCRSVDIDTEDDFAMAEYWINRNSCL